MNNQKIEELEKLKETISKAMEELMEEELEPTEKLIMFCSLMQKTFTERIKDTTNKTERIATMIGLIDLYKKVFNETKTTGKVSEKIKQILKELNK